MAAPFNTISKLFRVHLKTLTSPPDIYWENVKYDPTPGTVHLRPKMIWLTGQLLDNAKRQINEGIFSVGVYVPPDIGEKVLNTWIDAIYTLFQSNLSLAPIPPDDVTFLVDILAVSRSSIRRDDNFVAANVDIRWVNYN